MDENKSVELVKIVLGNGSNFNIDDVEELNKGIDHIVHLITDAFYLYNTKSYSTAVFLSIVVIEEVAKLHLGLYNSKKILKGRKDFLKDHKSKQINGTNYTISMSNRLVKAIGKDSLEIIFELSYSGELKKLREDSLYCGRYEGKFMIPDEIIDNKFSKNLLLFAIESFDDNLVGYTNHSLEMSKITDEIFQNLIQ